MLRLLYNTIPGRLVLKVLTNPDLSMLCGKFLDSKYSCGLIAPFVKKNGIDMDEYEDEAYGCFNDFFCRRIKKGYRKINKDKKALISPCDGFLSGYKIKDDLVVPVKQSRYSISDLLRDEELAKEFEGGYCLVFRLGVNNYHRYCYPDSGHKTSNVFLPGILHTVQPIALRKVPVFVENSREYTVLDTDHFGRMVQMEVGAMLVGKIDNYHGAGRMKKGMEKGRFLYGGSTIILLTTKDSVWVTEKLFRATKDEIEIPVKYGQKIGVSRRKGIFA